MLKILFFLFFSLTLSVIGFFALDQYLGLGYFKPKTNFVIAQKAQIRQTDSLIFVHVSQKEQKNGFKPFVLDSKKANVSLENNIKAKINPKIKLVAPASAKKKTQILGKKEAKKAEKKTEKKAKKKAPVIAKKKNPCDCPCDKKTKKA